MAIETSGLLIDKNTVIKNMQALVAKYQLTSEGSWILSFDWKKIPVDFKDFRNDVCGAYSCGKIWLLTSFDERVIFPVYVHELRHRYQWLNNPIKYIIGKVFRPLIETDAYEQQELAEEWIAVHHDEDSEITKAVGVM